MQTANPEETVRKLLAERTPIYALADIMIDSRDGPHEIVVDAIMRDLIKIADKNSILQHKPARALEVDETRGFMKAVVDTETGQILGATVLGLEGGEIATLFQLAMMGRLPYTALRDGVFSHPTLAEALNNLFAAMDRSGEEAG